MACGLLVSVVLKHHRARPRLRLKQHSNQD